ncbi:cytochrome c family protein [Thiohalocapsa halophila]
MKPISILLKRPRQLRLRGLAPAALALLATTAFGAAAQAEESIHHVSSEVCASCHQEIFKQWQGSMHANSTALKDPIHGTFYKMVVGDPTAENVKKKGTDKYPICLQCHAPNAAKDGKTKLDAMAAYSEGVNCVACHTLKKFKGVQGEDGKLRLGLKAYEVADTLQGPQGVNNGLAQLASASDDLFGGVGVGGGASSQKPNPHLGEPVEFEGEQIQALPMEGNPRLMKTSDSCWGCHDQRNNPHGVPLCQTGNEYIDSKTDVNCLSCHMPVTDGVADHTMGGGHSKPMLKRSVVFDVTSERDGDMLKTSVYIKNQQPHAMPTGAPFRNIYVKLTAYDDAGQPIWQNAEGHPAKDDPQAYMAYALADDEGMPAPPPTATQPGDDTRLKPHEERVLEYEIPAEGVALVRGELYYNLLWPGLVKKFDHLPEDVKEPVLIAESEKTMTAE